MRAQEEKKSNDINLKEEDIRQRERERKFIINEYFPVTQVQHCRL
jgi:hypothetical protein